MAKDHFIPAALLGNFSAERNGPLRLRRIAVQRRGCNPQLTRAENVGYAHDLYKVTSQSKSSVDDSWSQFERRLPEAISVLEASQAIEAEIWLRVLVPYVASLFVRGLEWEKRYISRFTDAWGQDILTSPALDSKSMRSDEGAGSTIRDILTESNSNSSRLIELQRILALVTCAKWNIVHSVSTEPFLNNDLGMTGTIVPNTNEIGLVVPLSRTVAVRLFPRDRRWVVRWDRDKWLAVVDHDYLSRPKLAGLNRAVAAAARDFVVGPDIKSVASVAPYLGQIADHRPLMNIWPFTAAEKRVNEFHWHRLVSLTHRNEAPPELTQDTDIRAGIDWSALAEGWMPGAVIFGMNTTPRETGLELRGRSIMLTLRDEPWGANPVSKS